MLKISQALFKPFFNIFKRQIFSKKVRLIFI
mgnify:CR=1 FL=1